MKRQATENEAEYVHRQGRKCEWTVKYGKILGLPRVKARIEKQLLRASEVREKQTLLYLHGCWGCELLQTASFGRIVVIIILIKT